MRRTEVGFFSFTEVPAHAHAAYNEWHQLDHLPSQFVLDGVHQGERWVLTPGLRAAAPVLDDVIGRAQYLTLYLMGPPLGETLAEFRHLAAALRDADRFFAERRSHLNGAWAITDRAAADRVLVDAAVVPWRPARGVVAIIDPAEAASRSLAELTAIDGVAGAWVFERDAALAHPTWTTGPFRITVLWVDGDPAPAATAVPVGAAVHVAGYERIVPGEWRWFD